MKELGLALSLKDIEDIIYGDMSTCINAQAMSRIEQNYQKINLCASVSRPIYGINTGFGALAEQRIDAKDQAQLQRNIILSHAVGVGAPLDLQVARTLMLLRLNTLLQGYSGASPGLISHLHTLFLNKVAPLVPSRGSVGASGDLAPLAHLGILLLGLGDAYVDQQRCSALSALNHASLKPLDLGLRDGLALINGTQAMASLAVNVLRESRLLNDLADINVACALLATAGHLAPFDHRLHELKPHPGQLMTARRIRLLLGDVQALRRPNPRTQDPYSLRCVPQVHGASKDAITHISEVVAREINAVTDNPLIFVRHQSQYDHEGPSAELDIVSGGNFHGQHLAMVLDYLAIALAELANIAERRLEILLNPVHSNGLPAFLIKNGGLNSGYMMLQVTAASLVNENKVLTHPASTDSIPTSANREDHVSMGMTSANKVWQIMENVKTVLAIEHLAVHQALDFLDHKDFGIPINKIHEALREIVPFREQDVLYHEDLSAVMRWLDNESIRQLFSEVLS